MAMTRAKELEDALSETERAREDHKRLLLRYADGRSLCNCSLAYEDADGTCPHGCSAARINATEEVCSRAMREIDALEAKNG